MAEPITQKVAKAYGLDVKRYLPMQTGYRNKNYPLELTDGRTINLILYKREPGIVTVIRLANEIGSFLHANGFPARYPCDKRIIRVFASPNEQFAALYAYLPGETIPWEAYTMAHIKALGQTMSNMHALLANQNGDGLPAIHEVYGPIIKRMQYYFDDVNVCAAIASKLGLKINTALLDEFKQLMRISKHLPGQQPLHMDFVRSNILFAKNSHQITGVLDFEKVAYGAPVFDIARTLAFLLVDCKYKTEAQVRKYFLKSGYNKYGNVQFTPVVAQLNAVKIDTLEQAIDLFLTYDFYKFLRHNPYEFLNQNQHFVRTANLLIARGVIGRR